MKLIHSSSQRVYLAGLRACWTVILFVVGLLSSTHLIHAAGFYVEGYFLNERADGTTTNRFRMQVDGAKYHLWVGSPDASTMEDIEIGSDGVDAFLVNPADSIRTTRGVLMSGRVAPGPLPPQNSPTICQVLWLAYASAEEIASSGHTNTSLIPNSFVNGEDRMPWWDIRAEPVPETRMNGLPAEIKYFAPNYFFVKKSEVRGGGDPEKRGYFPSRFPDRYQTPYGAPFTNGYMVMRYLTVDRTNCEGQWIPARFQCFRSGPAPGAKTAADLEITHTYEGFVEKCSALSGDVEFLPKLSPDTMIHDDRLVAAGEGRTVYTVGDGHWYTRDGSAFQKMYRAYQKGGGSAALGSRVFWLRLLILFTFVVLPLGLLVRSRRRARKTKTLN